MNGSRLVSITIAIGIVAAFAAWLTLQVLLPREAPLEELFPMPSFELTSEQGKALSDQDLRGKVVVANFIFTRCPTVCPALTARMAKIQKQVLDDDGVHLLSFSVDPKHDTPEVLREFGAKYDQDPSRWTFLTGDLAEVMKAVEEGFRIGITGADDPEATPFDIVHGEHFVLVDKAGTIRGYYPNCDLSLQRLVRDAKRLAKEG